jgi:hypothetical protein
VLPVTYIEKNGNRQLLVVLEIRIRMFLGLPDPGPLVRGTDPIPAPDQDPKHWFLVHFC